MYVSIGDTTGQTSAAIDLKRAVRLNRRYAQRLGWQVRREAISRLLRLTSPADEDAFAKAVASWQAPQGLKADGVLGPNTWSRMQAALQESTPASNGSRPAQPSAPTSGSGAKGTLCAEVIGKAIVLDGFDVGDYRLKPRHYEPLLNMAGQARTSAGSSGGVMLLIEGHADDTGGSVMNKGLSFQRAVEVKHHLTEVIAKISKNRVSVPVRLSAKGEDNPISVAPRSKNRRVVVRLCREPQPNPAPARPGAIAKPSKAASKTKSDIVRIILIDPTGIFKNKNTLREEFRSKLEDKFNNLDPDWLRQAHFNFRVEYRSNEPTDAAKAQFGRFDFPVYLLDKQHGSATVQKLMKGHKIPQTVSGSDIYDLADQGWRENHTRGIGIPSGTGYRKVAFIKSHRVFEDATADLWRAFVNVTAHEIGHMGNRRQHSKTGLMKYPVPLNIDVDFSNPDKYLFLSDLVRLRRLRP